MSNEKIGQNVDKIPSPDVAVKNAKKSEKNLKANIEDPKNNEWFKSTNKDMMNVMASNASKIKRYMKKYGQDKVENFIDRVLSLENLISQENMLLNFFLFISSQRSSAFAMLPLKAKAILLSSSFISNGCMYSSHCDFHQLVG